MSNREGTPNLTREQVLVRLADAVGGDASPYAALLQRSIWLQVDQTREAELMGSRFGGPAMVPDGFEWPMYVAEPYMGRDPNEDPKTFTLWYAKQQKLPMETPLPREGLLSFFTDPFDGVWGNEKSDQQGVRIVYIPPERFGALRALHRPKVAFHAGAFADWTWPEHRMEYYTRWTFYNWDMVLQLCMQTADAQRGWGKIMDIVGYVFGHFLLDGGKNHDTDPRCSAELTWNPDPEPPEGIGYEAYCERREQFNCRAIATWTCLLSIRNDDVLRPVVGDCGGLSFLMRKSDLAERRFDRPWIVRS